MALKGLQIKNIFPHSREFETGGGRERAGKATVVVALDGTGDTDSIQEGINLLPKEGGIVSIKEGTYNILSKININLSNVILRGVGRGTKIASSTNIGIIEIGSVTGVIISNLFIFGSGNGDSNHGIRLNGSTKCRVESCWLEDTGISGILMQGNDNIIIGNNLFNCGNDASGGNSLSLSSADSCTIIGNIIDQGRFSGISIFNSDKNIIEGNTSINNPTNGVRITGTSDRNIVIGNILLDNTSAAVFDSGTNTHPNGASGTNNLEIDDLNIIA